MKNIFKILSYVLITVTVIPAAICLYTFHNLPLSEEEEFHLEELA